MVFMNKNFKKEVYRVFLGLALATASTSLVNPLNAKAVPIEQTIEDANKDEQLKRMKKDYEKICSFHYYPNVTRRMTIKISPTT